MSTSVPSQDCSRRLNCLIKSESIVFSVTVGRDCVVSELKEAIQGKRAMGVLKGVDPPKLELSMVSAIDESRCKVTWLSSLFFQPSDSNPITAKPSDTLAERIGSCLTDKLDPTDTIFSIFPTQPPGENVHIIVKVSQKRNITPKDLAVDIEVIDKRIDKELESLRGVVETFLKNPEPSIWVPPDYVTPNNREFLTNLRIPSYGNGNPSLLFHDLEVCDDNEIEKIFGRGTPLYVVINCVLNPSYHGL
jgi:hypothetical protein